MTTIVDVADYILNKYGTMTTMKLQKLTFYAQTQALAVTGHPLFEEDFEAWKGGPVSRKTHSEKPWQEARGDALPNAASSEVISKESMRRFHADNPIVQAGQLSAT